MKNYNKILEAVNRGIQLALDDFDDEEPIKNIINLNKFIIETILKNIQIW